MYIFSLILFFYVNYSYCKLWSKGIVHYSINTKDYDPHSQDVIMSTLQKIQSEICVKFFNIPANYTSEDGDKVLYIQNPSKLKICAQHDYDFDKSVIDMAVGYKCIREFDIAKMVVSMLKASIHKSESDQDKNNDLLKTLKQKNENHESGSLLSPEDRNFINAHYFQECAMQTQRSAPSRRQFQYHSDGESAEAASANIEYYKSKVWPLGIVVYKVENISLRNTPEFANIMAAMRNIELESCVMFEEADGDDELGPRNVLRLEGGGAEWPHLGFYQGAQTLKLSAIGSGPGHGHDGHAAMMMMRVLGVPMMSNRFDRDNYLRIHWRNVEKGKELFLEKAPDAAWLKSIPYDFGSVTHAPANFLCSDCYTKYTVEPIQDHLWHRTLSMGRSPRLSRLDAKMLSILYRDQCQARVAPIPDNLTKLAYVVEDGDGPRPDENEEGKAYSGGAYEGEADAEGSEGGKAEAEGEGKAEDGGSDVTDVVRDDDVSTEIEMGKQLKSKNHRDELMDIDTVNHQAPDGQSDWAGYDRVHRG